MNVERIDSDRAWDGSKLWRALCWRFGDKKPPAIKAFNEQLLKRCLAAGASDVICAGNLPVLRATLDALRNAGCRIAAWLTDDPWNPAHRTARMMEALSGYDLLLTPRRANMAELEALAPGRVKYLPFGYDPRYFHSLGDAEPERLRHEVFFAGGADADRVPLMATLQSAGVNLGLYGDYWRRYADTRDAFKGYANPEQMADLIHHSAVCLCLVRRANRDGHSMRTYELGGAGACILAEDTGEHRALYGDHGKAVYYFSSDADALAKVRALLADRGERERLRRATRVLFNELEHSYAARLRTLLAMEPFALS